MKHKLYLALCCGALVIVMLVLPDSINRRIRAVIGDVFTPFASLLYGVPPALARFMRDRGEIQTEHEKMAIELEKARYELLGLRALEEENRKLRGLVGLAESEGHRLVAGRVVARDISGWWRKVRLNIGMEHGVKPDMPVVSGNGLVGRTASVSSRNSDVLLMIDPSSRVSVRALDSEAFGIIRGGGVTSLDDALCRMEFISGGALVAPGEDVVTSGLGGIYPRGIIIGRVKAVYPDPSGLYKNADVLPAVDFRALDIVFVVLTGKESR